jgi:hypothetical protein
MTRVIRGDDVLQRPLPKRRRARPLYFLFAFLAAAFVIGVGVSATGASLENPQPDSAQSGIGLFSGWSCTGPDISVSIDGAAPLKIP